MSCQKHAMPCQNMSCHVKYMSCHVKNMTRHVKHMSCHVKVMSCHVNHTSRQRSKIKGPWKGLPKTLRPKCSRPGDPLWSLLPKGTAEGLAQNTPAKMLSAGRTPVVPFAKRDRGTRHKRKRDRGWGHYLDSIS